MFRLTNTRSTIALLALPLAIAGCATAPGPVEVTRFVAADSASQLGAGPIFITSAPEQEAAPNGTLEAAPFRSAVAAELTSLGYSEAARGSASQIAEVRVERFVHGEDSNRGPVSVGVGGSAGSYGSGVGLGIGINLGGNGGPELGTELGVTIRDAASGEVLWEGRADFAVKESSELARGPANAQTVAKALFQEFPGNNGETIAVKVSE